ncbi:MAG: RluA family pseudouridine synthase [Epsilonproteobacteria bacterium]|nr:RluA family pseudouridine synthase [Campylobacterota bacterium]
MAYVRRNFKIKEKIKAYKFLMQEFNLKMSAAQKWIDRKRVYLNGEILQKKNIDLLGNLEVIFFKPEPKGIKPIFETENFAIFDKPNGILVHPNKLSEEYSLNDEIKFLYGMEANAVHRIDKETSGLVLVAKNKKSEIELKNLFEKKEIKKEYLAIVKGEINKNMIIDASLKSNDPSSIIRIKAHVSDIGQKAITRVEPIKFDKIKNRTLVIAKPLTGRTHQIRAHMFHVKHSIVGDPIYGIDEIESDLFLSDKMSKEKREKITGAKRLMLHANFLSFTYKNLEYNIKSISNFKEKYFE